MTIETTHNGHLIRYGDNSDEWTCPALDLSAKTLSALKAKLNDFDAKERKLGKNGVTMILLSRRRYGNEGWPQVRATMLDKGIDEESKHAVLWVSHTKDGTREKVGLHALIADTAENRTTLDEADRLEKEARESVDKAEKMRANIKRFGVAEIKAMALETKMAGDA